MNLFCTSYKTSLDQNTPSIVILINLIMHSTLGLLLQGAGKSAVLNSLIGHPVLVYFFFIGIKLFLIYFWVVLLVCQIPYDLVFLILTLLKRKEKENITLLGGSSWKARR